MSDENAANWRAATKVLPAAVVTDHALVRYLERVKGLDMQAIRDEILTDRNVAAMEFVGCGRVPICRGANAIVRDMTVITVLA